MATIMPRYVDAWGENVFYPVPFSIVTVPVFISNTSPPAAEANDGSIVKVMHNTMTRLMNLLTMCSSPPKELSVPDLPENYRLFFALSVLTAGFQHTDLY